MRSMRLSVIQRGRLGSMARAELLLYVVKCFKGMHLKYLVYNEKMRRGMVNFSCYK